jgi:capsular exopolysaccharide synthesis family protein
VTPASRAYPADGYVPQTPRHDPREEAAGSMSIRQFVQVLRRRWLSGGATLLLALGAAVALTLSSDPVYRAQTSSFVTVGSVGDSGTLLQGSQFALQRVTSYTQVVDSPTVLQPVIDELRLDETVGSLAGRVDAVNPSNTVLVLVSATGDDPAEAAAVANAVTRQFAAVIEELERPREGNASAVKVTITTPADVPSAPVSPRPLLNVVLGLLVGAGLAAGVALLRDQLDSTLRSSAELGTLTRAGVLGLVPHNPAVVRQPLVALDNGDHRAEAFRTIRTNLQFVDVDHPPRSLVVTSSVAGEGKSTTAVNLAITLAQGGRRVCLVDADMRRPRVAELLGVEGAVGLSNVLAGQYEAGELVVPWHGGLLSALPAGTSPPNPSELLGSRQMSELLASLTGAYDMVIVDSPPLLPVSDALILAEATDGALLVVRHGSTHREHVEAAVAATTRRTTTPPPVPRGARRCGPRARGQPGPSRHRPRSPAAGRCGRPPWIAKGRHSAGVDPERPAGGAVATSCSRW